MSISRTVVLRLHCDGTASASSSSCSRMLEIVGDSRVEVDEKAERCSWYVGRSKAFCPGCRKKK